MWSSLDLTILTYTKMFYFYNYRIILSCFMFVLRK